MSALSSQQRGRSANLGTLLQGLPEAGALPAGLQGLPLTDVTLDSRQVTPGGLFLALPGTETDGRDYVDAALEAGAAAVLYEKQCASSRCEEIAADGRALGIVGLRGLVGPIASRFHGDPSLQLSITGITGTNGKTTCAWLLAQALEQLGERCAIMGTIGNGFPDDLSSASLTTADAISIQRNLNHWFEAGATAVCMEVSSHGLDQERVNGVRFHTAVFTNLTRDHLDYHGDMDAYAEAKKQLFRMPGLEVAVINHDDPIGREILAEATLPAAISYGVDGGDVTVTDAEFNARCIRFSWRWRQQTFTGQANLIGEINLVNLLAVIATLLGRRTDPEDINRILPLLQPPPGRMERVPGGNNAPTVIVDYSHTPDSLERALRSLRPLTPGRLLVVFGCGGDRDPGKRALMGSVAGQNADRVIITNDNPRGEDPSMIAAMVRSGVEEVGALDRYQVELDRAAAIELAIHEAGQKDVVLIAGKGHESTQTIGGSVLPFSDRTVAIAALEGRH